MAVDPWPLGEKRIDSASRRTAALAVLIITSGVAIRLWHYLANRSLYIDEARLALNIGTRSFAGLFQPLDLEQVAPVPFLLAVKASVELFGMSELSLRLVPFIAGCVALPLMWRLSARLLRPPVALLALSLFALSPALVRASNDVKPYSLDSCLAVALLLLALRALRDPTVWRVIALSLMSITAALCSFTAPIVIGGVHVVIGIALVMHHRRRELALLASGAAVAVAGVLTPYLTIYREVGQSVYMREFWSAAHLSSDVADSWRLVVSFIWGWLFGGLPPWPYAPGVSLAVHTVTAAVALLVLLGGWLAYREWRGPVTGLLLVPAAVFLLLNIGEVYPAAIRLNLFLVPMVSLLVALGLARALGSLNTGSRHVAGLLAILPPLAVVSTVLLIPQRWPYQWQELRPLMYEVNATSAQSARYISAGAAPSYLYYSISWERPDIERLRWFLARIGANGAAFENASAQPPPAARVDLRYAKDGIAELLGASTGQRFQPYIRASDAPLGESWVRPELERVSSLDEQCVWLLFANYRRAENELLDALEGSGHRHVRTLSYPGAVGFLYASSHEDSTSRCATQHTEPRARRQQ